MLLYSAMQYIFDLENRGIQLFNVYMHFFVILNFCFKGECMISEEYSFIKCLNIYIAAARKTIVTRTDMKVNIIVMIIATFTMTMTEYLPEQQRL